MPAAELAEVAVEVYGEDRVTVEPRLADAIDEAVGLAEDQSGSSIGAGGVLVTGSVVTVGEARAMLRRRRPDVTAAAPERSPRRGMCAAVLSLEAITLGLTTPVMIKVAGRATPRSRWPWGWGSRWRAC